MSKGKGDLRQRIKNGITNDNNPDRVRIRRIRKKEPQNTLNNFKRYAALLILFLCFGIIISYFGYQYYLFYKVNLVRQPINLKLVTDKNDTDAINFWGAYRPQLFFGMNSLSKISLKTGLLWFTQPHQVQRPDIRYWCKNDGGIKHFGWEIHDGKRIGRQRIVDNNQQLITTFIKNSNSWINKIDVRTLKERIATSVMYYLYLPESTKYQIKPLINGGRLYSIKGNSADIGEFQLSFDFKMETKSKNKYQNSFLVANVPREDKILQTIEAGLGIGEKDRLIGLIGGQQMSKPVSENIWVFELTGYGNFTVDVTLKSTGNIISKSVDDSTLSRETFQNYFDKYSTLFHSKFKSTFQIDEKTSWTPNQIQLAEATFSQLIGGIGYFYGEPLVISPWSFKEGSTKEFIPLKYWSLELLTSTPSRTVFPRGFLWDEGFHTLLLGKWDPKLALIIIGYWLDSMNVDGWIPREQILGWEARAKVPDEFVVQDSKNGNPPTFILTLQDINERFENLDTKDQAYFIQFLDRALPRLEAWFNWFNTTQVGEGYANYQWRGRSLKNIKHLNPLTLTSGLDDYPRSSHPTSNERHIDLRCWMAEFSSVLESLMKRVKWNEKARKYSKWSSVLRDETILNKNHWDPARSVYSDWGLHSEAVELKNVPITKVEPIQMEKQRTVLESPKPGFIPHTGYVSFFPLFLRILDPNSVHLGKLLNELESPQLLWTRYGLRSLSLTSRLYRKKNSEHDPPYWRGAIWININVLAVRSLSHYSKIKGPYQDKALKLYKQLRSNIVNSVLGNLDRTGYLWEQYDDVTGTGQRAHPFSGWTSLVVLLMKSD